MADTSRAAMTSHPLGIPQMTIVLENALSRAASDAAGGFQQEGIAKTATIATKTRGYSLRLCIIGNIAHTTGSRVLGKSMTRSEVSMPGSDFRRSFFTAMLVLLCTLALAGKAAAQESPHGNIRFECANCHTPESWKMRKDALFAHASTGFTLTGQHANLRCVNCHEGLKFQKKSSECLSCHSDVHKSELGTNCLRCHTMQSWQIADMVQKHLSTRFPLLGRHAAADCQLCHANAGRKQFAGTPTDCYGCHREDFIRTTSPNHSTAGFSTNCTQCHQESAMQWGTGFQHDRTQFPLTGAHRSIACIDCHKNQVFKSTSIQCITCHQNDYSSTQNPNHPSAHFATTCQTCHGTTVWTPSTFSHATTAFQLVGAHQTVACNQCHVNNVFKGLPHAGCWDCHATTFNGTINPNHVAGQFNHDCLQCHTQSAWKPASFNHATTKFALTGTHTTLPCAQCHTNGNYQLQYTDCYACHAANFAQPTNPNHVLGNFNHDCAPCHGTTVWTPSTFSHATTAFQLVGAHQTVACNQCHVNNVFKGLPHAGCWDCHATTFNGTINPNHVAGQFNHDCLQCHTQSAWKPASFNHATTKFALTGVHTTTQCAQCHTNGNYQLQYTDCYACHAAKFAQPTNPNHVLGNFNHDCAPCHGTTVWTPSTFSHATTAFQLVGAHQTVACNQCHVNNVFKGLPHAGCWDCHATTFNGTINPNHVAGQFNHDCLQCHTQSAWKPASFNHATTKFALTGAHTTLQCTQCHVNGNYGLSYQNCYQCHSVDYARPSSPNHVAQLFPTDCVKCHSTSVWTPNTMNHDAAYFRIYSGRHQGRWTQCSQCHTALGNLTSYNCATSCHRTAHNQGQDCYSCHKSV